MGINTQNYNTQQIYNQGIAYNSNRNIPHKSVYTHVDLNSFKLDDYRFFDHGFFSKHARALNGPNRVDKNGWSNFLSNDRRFCPWKMHIYAGNEADWQYLAAVVAPYLQKVGLEWKTFDGTKYLDKLDKSSPQFGKAFTVYFRSPQEFLNTACDLDYIISNNNLNIKGSKIQGDRQLGNTGRLFYRYALNSGRYKDKVFDMKSPQDKREYYASCESNRGADNYLANDMTIKDDPFYNVVP